MNIYIYIYICVIYVYLNIFKDCISITFITLNLNISIFYIISFHRPPVIQQGDWESRQVERSGSITSHSTGPNNKGGLKQSSCYGFYGYVLLLLLLLLLLWLGILPWYTGILVSLVTTNRKKAIVFWRKFNMSLIDYWLSQVCVSKVWDATEMCCLPKKTKGTANNFYVEIRGHSGW